MPVTLNVLLNFSAVATELALVVLLIQKGTFKTFPVFCAYLIWDLLDNIGLYLVLHTLPDSYFIAYLVALAIDSLFVLIVLVELASSVLRPFRSALPRRTAIIIALLMVGILAAIWPFTHSVAYTHYGPQSRLLLHLQQTVAIMRVLFFLVLAGCSQLLSINWRDREMQIATGLGLYSFVTVAVSILQAGQTVGSLYHDLDRIALVSYLGSLVYWLFSFARQAAPRREFTPQMQNFLLAVAGTARSTRVAITAPGNSDLHDREK